VRGVQEHGSCVCGISNECTGLYLDTYVGLGTPESAKEVGGPSVEISGEGFCFDDLTFLRWLTASLSYFFKRVNSLSWQLCN
jgi:hypothetical protein